MEIKGPITIKKGEDVSKVIQEGSSFYLPFSVDGKIEVEKKPDLVLLDSDGSLIDMVKK